MNQTIMKFCNNVLIKSLPLGEKNIDKL